MKKGFTHNALVRIIPLGLAWLLRLWFATCRIKEHGNVHRTAALSVKGHVIAIFWHYSIVYSFFHLRNVSAAILVSASEDGEYIAQLARRLNFATVRGSRNRGGVKALKELLSCLKSGMNIGMVADGSQGPPRVVQPGSLLLAAKTGTPILPMVWSASRYVTVKSWDRTALPLPFSRIDYWYGEPFLVPAGLASEEVELYRLQLEQQVNELYRTAWSRYGKDGH